MTKQGKCKRFWKSGQNGPKWLKMTVLGKIAKKAKKGEKRPKMVKFWSKMVIFDVF